MKQNTKCVSSTDFQLRYVLPEHYIRQTVQSIPAIIYVYWQPLSIFLRQKEAAERGMHVCLSDHPEICSDYFSATFGQNLLKLYKKLDYQEEMYISETCLSFRVIRALATVLHLVKVLRATSSPINHFSFWIETSHMSFAKTHNSGLDCD